MLFWFIYPVLGLVCLFLPAPALSNVDLRCSCKCPGIDDVFGDNSSLALALDYPQRKLYINSTVIPQDCDCEHVIQPVLNLDFTQMEKLCPRCKCTYQKRSTTTIKFVIILILWILCILAMYLLYLVFVEPMFKGKQIQMVRRGFNTSQPYQQQENDDHGAIDNDVTATPLRSYDRSSLDQRGDVNGSVVNRLGREADRWKRQVEIQRHSVYDRHTMLN